MSLDCCKGEKRVDGDEDAGTHAFSLRFIIDDEGTIVAPATGAKSETPTGYELAVRAKAGELTVLSAGSAVTRMGWELEDAMGDEIDALRGVDEEIMLEVGEDILR